MTARLDLAMQLDEWRQNPDHPIQVLQHFNTVVWQPEALESIRGSIILSAHYYFTLLLINAPVLTMALAETQKHWPLGVPSSMLHESAKQVLRGDFEAAEKLQTLVQGFHSFGGPFIDSNAIWFLCNYSSTSNRCRLTTWIHTLTDCPRGSVYGFTPRLWSPALSQGPRLRCS